MATNFATASYQEIIDINTESDKTSIIGIHTPNDSKPVRMLNGFWEQFRQFRYDGCSIQLVPAARLPADPLQVSYEAGEPTIDPRDLLNPILFKGCHGNDLGVILNQALNQDDLGDSLTRADSPVSAFDPYESLYYRALTDNSWKKANPQIGFKKSGLVPLVHQVVSTNAYGQFAPGYDGQGVVVSTNITPFVPPVSGNGYLGELGPDSGGNFEAMPLSRLEIDGTTVKISGDRKNDGFFTNRLVRMSWQDTHSLHLPATGGLSTTASSGDDSVVGAQILEVFSDRYEASTNRCQTVPLAYMGILILPPAYKSEQYFRMVINHRFSFRKFRGVSMAPVQKTAKYLEAGTGDLVTNFGGYMNATE